MLGAVSVFVWLFAGAGCSPLFEPKILQLPPALGHDELTPGLPKGIPTTAAYIGLVSLRICHPVEDLRGEDVVAELGSLGADLVQDSAGKKHCGSSE